MDLERTNRERSALNLYHGFLLSPYPLIFPPISPLLFSFFIIFPLERDGSCCSAHGVHLVSRQRSTRLNDVGELDTLSSEYAPPPNRQLSDAFKKMIRDVFGQN